MAPYEALYGRKCQSPLCWNEGKERSLMDPTFVEEATEKIKIIQRRMKAAQDRQKKYYDIKHRMIEFEEGQHVFIKVSPTKGIIRFGKAGKLKPKFIGPFQILERVGQVAYRLALPPQLAGVHNVFHVSVLRRYIPDPSHVVNYIDPNIEIQKELTYLEKPMRILDRQEKKLRNKVIPMVKVLWHGQTEREATWEVETDMISRYPELF
ncbi:hypothetical protein HPP92_011500 [Vanilla planifolia]|uniref:Chromo domain-containing protein n=1 Tax=Vanilla planifolia TaxID=51239 RepID=A0A835R768_VANPL|nr:hypothetical protein HPP92_011500 [Vanilla planifolia]